VCSIWLGTVSLQPLSAPSGRGTIAGSVFASNGQPLDGATVVVTDASGLVHTRTSGTNCDGNPIGGAAPTGFYCVADSTGDRVGTPGPLAGGGSNDGLGLPIGPASIVVVNNTLVGCPAPPAPATSNAGATCALLPAHVS